VKRGFGTVGVDFPYHLPPAEGLRPSFASEDTITWRKSGSNAELDLDSGPQVSFNLLLSSSSTQGGLF
jgi:hypothetical protein